MKRVALIDDHDVVSVAVGAAVSQVPELFYVGSASTVDELIETHSPIDIVVLDLRLADGSSPVANVARLDAAGAATVVFTSGESPYLIRSVSKAPIAGLVRKSEPLDVLVETLKQVAAGGSSMSADWAAAMDGDPQLGRAALSPQEQLVLSLFARGLKAQAVASRMGIAVGTVEDYVRRVRAKYVRAGRPAYTKVDLYMRAVEDGILPSPDSRQ